MRGQQIIVRMGRPCTGSYSHAAPLSRSSRPVTRRDTVRLDGGRPGDSMPSKARLAATVSMNVRAWPGAASSS